MSFLTTLDFLPSPQGSILQHAGRITTPWETPPEELDDLVEGKGRGGKSALAFLNAANYPEQGTSAAGSLSSEYIFGPGSFLNGGSGSTGGSGSGLRGRSEGAAAAAGGWDGGDVEKGTDGKPGLVKRPALLQSSRLSSEDSQPHASSSTSPARKPHHKAHRSLRPHPYEQESGEGEGEKDKEKGVVSGRAGVRRRQKYKRTRTGCLCCRQRRIKCDEERPGCKRCRIAKKECIYEDAKEGMRGTTDDVDDGKQTRSSTDASDSSDETWRYEQKRKKKGKIREGPASPVGEVPLLQICPAKPPTDADDQYVHAFTASSGQVPENSSTGPSSFDFPWLDLEVPPLPTNITTMAPASVMQQQQQEQQQQDGSMEWSMLSGPAGQMAGLQRNQWDVQGGGAPMLKTPNLLLPWFPTQEERSLILHYCANAADLMMAIPSGLNPMLAINLPLALDSPRGVNPAADALRVALLGIGAIHQAFLLARSGVSTSQTAAMFQYASNLRDSGKDMVRRAVLEGGGAKSDAALGAGTALATIDIFFGGGGWQNNFGLVKQMVAFRGGPAEMLKASEPKQLAEGVSLSPARLMLEILAIYETFGCMTTGEEPTLISDQWESWWFGETKTPYEEHSVEKQFGMSRTMVHLFARLTRLISRVSRSTLHPNILESLPTPPEHIPTPALMSTYASDPLVLEARGLSADVDAWIESLQITTLEHERVQVGNRAYAHAMKIVLLRRVFGCDRVEARVQHAAMEVMKHCSTSTALLGMSIDLTWPAIIAGCCLASSARQWLLTLLEGFKAQCCFDIETAGTIIQESWKRADAGQGRDDWKEVCEDLKLDVLLC